MRVTAKFAHIPKDAYMKLDEAMKFACRIDFNVSAGWSFKNFSRPMRANPEMIYSYKELYYDFSKLGRFNVSSLDTGWQNLTILNVSYTDAGNYTCIDDNNVDGANKSGAALVMIGEEGLQCYHNLGVCGKHPPSSIFNITCGVSFVGYVAPTLLWKRDGTEMASTLSSSTNITSATVSVKLNELLNISRLSCELKDRSYSLASTNSIVFLYNESDNSACLPINNSCLMDPENATCAQGLFYWSNLARSLSFNLSVGHVETSSVSTAGTVTSSALAGDIQHQRGIGIHMEYIMVILSIAVVIAIFFLCCRLSLEALPAKSLATLEFNRPIWGVAALPELPSGRPAQIYVITKWTNVISVFDAQSFEWLGVIELSEDDKSYTDIAACTIKSRLYVYDSSREVIWSVEIPKESVEIHLAEIQITNWLGLGTVPDLMSEPLSPAVKKPMCSGRISVSPSTGNVIFARNSDGPLIYVYSPEAALQHTIDLTGNKIEKIQHVYELKSEHFVLVHGDDEHRSHQHRVCVVQKIGTKRIKANDQNANHDEYKGKVVRKDERLFVFGRDAGCLKAQFRGPAYVVVDDCNNRVFVADYHNYRVAVLDSELKKCTYFRMPVKQYRLCYVAKTKTAEARLLIASDCFINCFNRVEVYEVIDQTLNRFDMV